MIDRDAAPGPDSGADPNAGADGDSVTDRNARAVRDTGADRDPGTDGDSVMDRASGRGGRSGLGRGSEEDRRWRWRPVSVRARTTAAATLVVAIALLAAGWATVHYVETSLTARVDDMLHRQLGVAAVALRDGAPLPLVDRAVTIRVDAPDGEVLAAPAMTSPTSPGSEPPRSEPGVTASGAATSDPTSPGATAPGVAEPSAPVSGAADPSAPRPTPRAADSVPHGAGSEPPGAESVPHGADSGPRGAAIAPRPADTAASMPNSPGASYSAPPTAPVPAMSPAVPFPALPNGPATGDAGVRRIVFVGPTPLATRTQSATVAMRGEGDVTVTADASTQSIREATTATTRLLLVAAPLLLLLVAASTWFATGRALRPVEAIRGEFARLTAQNLGRRVPVPRTGDEIARLAATLNDTLSRLEQATRRERQFVADASHELRSPLANVRTPLEVAARYPDRADWPDVAAGALEDLDRLEALITDLLTLARLDTGPELPLTPLDLGELVREVTERRPPGPTTWTVAVDDDTVVAGHRTHLARLLTNLLDNADAHAASSATLRLHATDGHAVLDVRDDGPGIPPAERERVFERFARLDTARTRAAGGTGLGLALARDIATLHGGTLTVADSERGAHIRLRLPLSAPDPASGPRGQFSRG
ncbi:MULTISPECIES: ATP-binding protein [unclassified Nocardia]|uniref:sensor histidine kinase n=1 Tax=unclassified Nocardia TaxID=2637762 RepID=UPI0024A93A67|nr:MULTISPECIES: ATP-binding protein [unclassified Nocardia]